MKLELAWTEGLAGQRPCARPVESDAVSPVACLLMDDGGLDAKTALAWLREGLVRVDSAIAEASSEPAHWDREDWGAVITDVETRVCSLHDATCAEALQTARFREVLAAWIRLLEAGSGSGPVVVDLA